MPENITLTEYENVNTSIDIEDSVNSGQFIDVAKKYTSYLTDDYLEYQKKYGILKDIPKRLIDRLDRWSEYLPETRQELLRIDSQSIESNGTVPGYFKLGTVELSIPPTQITINDIRKNFSYQTLRTNSDVTFTSGHSVKAIELDIFFNGIDDINDKLRPLIAQLKCSPFVTIRNEYISSVVTPGMGNINFMDDGEEKNAAEELAKLNTEKENAKNELKKELLRYQKISDVNSAGARNIVDVLNNKDSIGINDEIGISIDNSISENVSALVIDAVNSGSTYDYQKLLSVAAETEKKIDELNSMSVSSFDKLSPNRASTSNLVAVMSQMTVSIVQGFPDSIVCHASLYVFNYYPFSQKFEFIDFENMGTLDIDKCEFFIKWYSDRFLSKRPDNTEYLGKLERSMDGYVNFSYSPKVDDSRLSDPLKNTELSVSTDKLSACSSITVSHRNNIAFLPILSQSVPTCQYMGRNSPDIVITIDTMDPEFINSVRFLFKHVDSISRDSKKNRRKNYIKVSNEILRINGVSSAILQSFEISTVEGSPGLSRIVINMIAIDLDDLERENIKISLGLTDDRKIALFDVAFKSMGDAKESGDFKVMSGLQDACGITGSFNKKLDDYLKRYPITENDIRPVTNITTAPYGAGGNIGSNVALQKAPYTLYKALSEKVYGSENIGNIPSFDREIKLAIMESRSMAGWMSRKREAVSNYMRGTASGSNRYNLSKDEIAMLASRNIDKYQDGAYDVYPDLKLPLYSDLPGIRKVTFSQLGRRNYNFVDPESSPRSDTDKVEPDFYFNNLELKKFTGKLQTDEGDAKVSYKDIVFNSFEDTLSAMEGCRKNNEKSKNNKVEKTEKDTYPRNQEKTVDINDDVALIAKDKKDAVNANKKATESTDGIFYDTLYLI